MVNDYKPPLPRRRLISGALTTTIATLIMLKKDEKVGALIFLWIYSLGLAFSSVENLCMACGYIWLLVKYEILPKNICEECKRKYKITEGMHRNRSPTATATHTRSEKTRTKDGESVHSMQSGGVHETHENTVSLAPVLEEK